MHKKLVVFATLFCAGSAISAFADAAAYDNLKLSTNAWFSASVSGKTPNVTGGAIAATTGAELTHEDTKFVIDSDIDAPVTFSVASNNLRTNDIVMIDFDLDAAYVPTNLLATYDDLTNKDVKVGFAIKKGDQVDQNKYVAWVGGQTWEELSGTPPTEDLGYKVRIRVDGRTGKQQVQFAIVDENAETILTRGTDAWLPYETALEPNGSFAVDFVGSGAVTSFNGNQLNILAEVIVIGDDVVEVKEEDMKAFENTAPAGTTAAQFLATAAEEAYPSATGFKEKGLKVDQAYALGLLVKNDSTGKMVPVNEGKVNEGKLEIQATSAKVANDKIAVGFVGVTPRTDTGATFNYQLKGLKTGDTEWTDIGSALENEMPSIPVSAVGTYDFFKVVTTVTFPKK